MNRILAGLSLPALLLLLAAPALGQQVKVIQVQVNPVQLQPTIQPIAFGGNDATLELLKNKEVQAELKLTDAQAKAVSDLAKKQEETLKDLKGVERLTKVKELTEANKQIIAGMLMPQQNSRLEQLKVQQKGPMALRDPKIVKDLGITADQTAKFTEIQKASNVKRLDIFKQTKDPMERQKKLAELNKDMVKDMVKSLTPGQQQMWQDVAGEPFKGTLPPASPFSAISPLPIGPRLNPANLQPLPVQPKKILPPAGA